MPAETTKEYFYGDSSTRVWSGTEYQGTFISVEIRPFPDEFSKEFSGGFPDIVVARHPWGVEQTILLLNAGIWIEHQPEVTSPDSPVKICADLEGCEEIPRRKLIRGYRENKGDIWNNRARMIDIRVPGDSEITGSDNLNEIQAARLRRRRKLITHSEGEVRKFCPWSKITAKPKAGGVRITATNERGRMGKIMF